MKPGGALIIHLTLRLTWVARALDGGALRSLPTCSESVFIPAVNLYYKSDPHRGWQLLALRPAEALRWRPGGETRKFAASQGQSKGQRLLRHI